MKILMLAPEPFFQPRGTPISVYFRIKALSDLGHRVNLVTYPLGDDVTFKNATIRRAGRALRVRAIKIGPSLVKVPLDAFLFVRAFWELLKSRYDVIFSHEEAGWFGACLGKIFRIPHIYDMHSSLPQQLQNFHFSRSRTLKGIFLGLERFVLKNSGAVIVICRDLFDYVRKKGFGEKAVLLENFIDFNDFEERPLSAEEISRRKREIAPRGEKVVLYAGNFEPYQGIPLLVEAFALVASPAILLIVGGSKLEHDLMKKKAGELGVKGRTKAAEVLARGLFISTGEYCGNRTPGKAGAPTAVDPQTKPGAPAGVLARSLLNTQASTAEADPQTKPGAPAAAPAAAEGRIVFIEKVPPRLVPAYISLCDVLASPRVSGTNTPLKIYSFLKSGKPLVATDLWTHTQVLDERIAVLAAPEPRAFAAGLLFALESEDAQVRARAARRMADREYTYPKYLEKIAETLDRAAG